MIDNLLALNYNSDNFSRKSCQITVVFTAILTAKNRFISYVIIRFLMELQCFYRYFSHGCSYGFTDSFTADITDEYYCDFKVNSVSVCR